MSLFSRLFGPTAPPLVLEHPVFGTLTYSKHDGWENRAFAFWGFSPVQLLISGGTTGPTEAQSAAFAKLLAQQATLLPQLVRAVEDRQKDFHVAPGALSVGGLSIPSFNDTKGGRLWTMWFECAHDDHFAFGVQSDDDWATFVAFADD